MKKIGFIGLGEMGTPMAENLLTAGYKLYLYDIREEAYKTILSESAIKCKSIKEVGYECDIIIIMARTTDQVDKIILGEDGLKACCKPGTKIIIMATINPVTVLKIEKELNKLSIGLIDAPVSGGRQGAETGSLSIMVGGDKDIVDKVMPILNTLGSKIHYVGETGMGEVAKIGNNLS